MTFSRHHPIYFSLEKTVAITTRDLSTPAQALLRSDTQVSPLFGALYGMLIFFFGQSSLAIDLCPTSWLMYKFS